MKLIQTLAVLLFFSMANNLFPQTLQFRTDQITLPPSQLSTAKCVQMGIYMTTAGLGPNQDWSQISLNLDFEDPNNLLAATPAVVRISPFVGSAITPVPGISNPATALPASACNSSNIINAATMGGDAFSFMSNSQSTQSPGNLGFAIEDVNSNAKHISLTRLHTGTIFRTNDDQEYLVAVVEFSFKANPASASLVRLKFTAGSGQNIINRASRESLDAQTTDGYILIFEPLNCTSATITDTLDSESGTSISLKWLDPQVSGLGGKLQLGMLHPEGDPDQIRIQPSDGSSEIILTGANIGSGATTLDLDTFSDQTPSADATSISYVVTYGLNNPLGGLEEGTSCTLNATWEAPTCAIAFDPQPLLNQATQANVTLTNARFGANEFATFTGPNALSIPLATPTSTTGNSLSFDNIHAIQSLSLSDLGSYELSISGPGSQTSSCQQGIGLICPTNDFDCGSLGSAQIGGSLNLNLAGTNVISWDITYKGQTHTEPGTSTSYQLTGLIGSQRALTITANGFDAQGQACEETVHCTLNFANPSCAISNTHQNPTNCPTGIDYGDSFNVSFSTHGALSVSIDGVQLEPDNDPDATESVTWSTALSAATSGTILVNVLGPEGTTETSCSFESCVIPAVDFSDQRFENFALENYDTNQNGYLSPGEAAVPTSMDCGNLHIRSLVGIEAFVNLVELHCDENGIRQLPNLDSLTQLEVLVCDHNRLLGLPSLSALTNLRVLNCGSNELQELPELSALTNLQTLKCESNEIQALPSLDQLHNLTGLNCSNNQLLGLPSLAALTQLELLDCGQNQLDTLPELASLGMLKYLFCDFNKLTSLPDLSNSVDLLFLVANLNRITSFPDLSAHTKLERLALQFNQLTSVPDLSDHSQLSDFDCSFNFLQEDSCPALANFGILNYFQGNPLVEIRPQLPIWPGTGSLFSNVGHVNQSVYLLNCF